MEKPAPCPNGCDHTDQEHRAFDTGIRDGRAKKNHAMNPYKRRNLKDAWATGHSVGILDKEEED
jgi:ribosome modulation factor